MEVSDQPHAPAALPPGKSRWCQLDRRLGGLKSQSGRCGGDKNECPCKEFNCGHPAPLHSVWWQS